MLEIKYEIFNLKIKNLENDKLVSSATVRFEAREGIYVVEELVQADFTNLVQRDEFINFEDLSADIIIDWVKEILDFEIIKERLVQQLENRKSSSVTEADVPWDKPTLNSYNEYVLVVDNKTYGPFVWNSETANNILKENNINYIFPNNVAMMRRNLLSFTTPFVVSENATLYKVKYTEPIEIDTRYQLIRGHTYDFSTGMALVGDNVVDKSVDELKSLVEEYIEAEYNERFNQKVYVEIEDDFVGFKYDFDKIPELMLEYVLIGENDTINWQSKQGTVPLTKSKIFEILQALNKNKQDSNMWKINIAGQLSALNTVEQVKEFYINNFTEEN
jgi:hypothetical protein